MKELIHVDGPRVTWSTAVAKIADALNPLGSAAEIVAHIGACVTEINQFRLAAMQLDRQYAVATDIIRLRQATIVQVFEAEKRRAAETSVTRGTLLDGYEVMIRQASNMRIDSEERIMAMNTAAALSNDIVCDHISGGHELVRLSESLRFGDAETAIAAWRLVASCRCTCTASPRGGSKIHRDEV